MSSLPQSNLSAFLLFANCVLQFYEVMLQPYNSEKPAAFKPISDEELAKMKKDKKSREQQKKQKIIDSRRHLSDVR